MDSSQRELKGIQLKRIGLLPMYLELYDDTCGFMRPKIENYLNIIIEQLENRGLHIVRAPICRLKSEFEAAIEQFEEDGVSAIVTLHLAYSPSLECIDSLANTKIPLIVLDTTESYVFDETVGANEILYNHGIHGVQDMCNMLKRRKKKFEIFAGHYTESDVLNRVVRYCRGTQIADTLIGSRVGLIGKPFQGMGDFYVPFDDLKARFDMEIIEYDNQSGEKRIEDIDFKDINSELTDDRDIFIWDDLITNELYTRTTRVSLAVRKWIEEQNLSAFTINFLETEGSNPGLPIMPFTECSKAMSRGTGYAGEGDVLTAALCGALIQFFPQTTFTEMFCPDWKGGSIFLSHMGEVNYRILSDKPQLTEMNFVYTSAENTMVGYGTFQPGQAILVNLAPGSDGRYTLILSAGELLSVSHENNLKNSINGWFKPRKELEIFLEEFSRAGGTHHSVLVYEECITELTAFAAAMDFDFIFI